MPTFTLQFTGRFVFLESKESPGELKIVAIDPSRVRGLNAAPHAFLLSVETRYTPETFPLADYALVTANETRSALRERSVWILTDHDIAIPGNGFAWNKDADLNQLPELGALGGRGGFNDRAAAISGVISLHAGKGMPLVIKDVKLPSHWVRHDHLPAQSVPAGHVLADMVEVRIDDLNVLTIEIAPSRRVIISPRQASDSIWVAFSNICPQTMASGTDSEFAAFYEVCAAAPDLGQRLIPQTTQGTPFIDTPCFGSSRRVL